MKTNYGTLDVQIDPRTGRARRVDAVGTAQQVSKGYRSKGSPYRSTLEARFALHLAGLVAARELDGWRYEPVNFRLPGRKNFYTIDFLAWKCRLLTCYEVKGWSPSNERSLVKLKTAAGLHPWAEFVLVRWVRGRWEERVIDGGHG